MELWQIIYIVGVFAGLAVGVAISPHLAVVFIWMFIIAGETLHYIMESKGFEEEVEKAEEELEEP